MLFFIHLIQNIERFLQMRLIIKPYPMINSYGNVASFHFRCFLETVGMICILTFFCNLHASIFVASFLVWKCFKSNLIWRVCWLAGSRLDLLFFGHRKANWHWQMSILDIKFGYCNRFAKQKDFAKMKVNETYGLIFFQNLMPIGV